MATVMLLHYLILIVFNISTTILAYSNRLYFINNRSDDDAGNQCGGTDITPGQSFAGYGRELDDGLQFPYHPIVTTEFIETDPFLKFQNMKKQILMGEKAKDEPLHQEDYKLIKMQRVNLDYDSSYEDDALGHYPSGSVMHAELFQSKSAVHLPLPELIHSRHSYLKLTKDYMQTAVDAFSIFLEGTIDDVMKLPADYVLRSARTIAMMKIAKEKLAATWDIVKGDQSPGQISYQVLEMYRPLFKYINGREMARLNLSDARVLNFIGTHADLDRHQVGVIASRYLELNPQWSEPRYLNQMNNLLCGVPMTFMRRIPESTYLQLTHQVFYHIKACDPLQRRFYLTMMTKTQALGKSYSWSARDVSRLGLLLSEVDGSELAAVNPEAMSGLTAQVMLEIPPHTLKYITEMQLRYISQKPLNILAKRLKIYQDEIDMSHGSKIISFHHTLLKTGIIFVLNKIILRKP